MAEEVTSPAEASAEETPPAASPDDPLAALRAEMTAEFDKRIAGFQTVINKQTEELRELKDASLSDEEREQLVKSESEEYTDKLERELAMAKFVARYPDVAPVYQQLLDAETPDEQAAILKSLAQPKAPEVPATAPADVDPNNPAPTFGTITGRLADGTPISGDTAWEMLRKMGPGAVSG